MENGDLYIVVIFPLKMVDLSSSLCKRLPGRVTAIHWIGLRENLQETHGFLPSNWTGFPVPIFPSSNIIQFYEPFIVDFPMKTSIYEGFSMAMLVITRG